MLPEKINFGIFLFILFCMRVCRIEAFYSQLMASSLAPDEIWAKYKKEAGKIYQDPREEKYRYNVWMENYNYVLEHNKKADGSKDFYVEMNPYCDMSQEEFAKIKLGLKLKPEHKTKLRLALNSTLNTSNGKTFKLKANSRKLPDSINWVEKGFISPVKDQGTCGACWSFVTTSSLESYARIKKNLKRSYSEQNLIDCTVPYGNEGCNGGLMSQAFEYIMDNKGINSDSIYKYTGILSSCRFSKDENGNDEIQVGSYVNLPVDEEAIKAALATIGPVAVGIDANHKSFTLYKGGIYNNPKCSATDLNHAILIVGYGSENGKDYWLFKNSWGTKWGESGYGRLARNKNNHCGIASLAGFPVIE